MKSRVSTSSGKAQSEIHRSGRPGPERSGRAGRQDRGRGSSDTCPRARAGAASSSARNNRGSSRSGCRSWSGCPAARRGWCRTVRAPAGSSARGWPGRPGPVQASPHPCHRARDFQAEPGVEQVRLVVDQGRADPDDGRLRSPSQTRQGRLDSKSIHIFGTERSSELLLV